jgi:tRNA 2-thiouridine synthesizing protein A
MEKEIASYLDLTGLKCPLPILKAQKQLRSMVIGERLHITATDPVSFIDFPHFCAEKNHALLESSEVDGVFTFLIEK